MTTRTVVVDPRQLALRHVLNDPEHHWKRLPARYRHDKEFVLAVVQQAVTLPPKSDFERAFPPALRLDRDIVLAFGQRPDLEQLYHERHWFVPVPTCFTNDRHVMMTYCAQIPRLLQHCRTELCDEESVVRAAVQRNGWALQYASLRWQCDEPMVRLACASDGRALEFCPFDCPAHTKLWADQEFLQTQVFPNGGASLYRQIQDPELKQDRTLLLCAVNHGLEWRSVPRPFQNDPEVVTAAVTRNAHIYLELPLWLQQNGTIARAAVLSQTSNAATIFKAAQCAPVILPDERVAQAVADRADVDFLQSYLYEHPQFLQVKQVMLRAVQRHARFYTMASPVLQRDIDIVLSAMGKDSAGEVLRSVSKDFVLQHPEVALQAVQESSTGRVSGLGAHIPDALWNNHRELQVAWLRRGGHVLPSLVDAVRTDRELALLVAEHCFQSFCFIDIQLRMGRDFMIAAVSLDGRVLQYAAYTLLRDWELLVRAVANHPEALDPAVVITTHSELKKYCKQCLRAYDDVFVREFLRGIVAGGPTCTLTQLNRGLETGEMFKKNVAAFLGIPLGSLLQAHRQCYDNLNRSTPSLMYAKSLSPVPSEARSSTSRRRRRSPDNER